MMMTIFKNAGYYTNPSYWTERVSNNKAESRRQGGFHS